MRIELSADSAKIILKGLNNDILQSLKTDSLPTEGWQHLFAVYKETAADDLQTDPLPGMYSVVGKELMFSPEKPFESGNIYTAIFYYPDFYSAGSIWKERKLPGKTETVEQEFQF